MTFEPANDGTAISSPMFVPEIMAMMQSMGDGPNSNAGSAELIEQLVRQRMNSSLLQCHEVAIQRGSRSIGLQEILFLMRRDTLTLVRLLRHLSFKDGLSQQLHSSHFLLFPETPNSSSSSSSLDPNLSNADSTLYPSSKLSLGNEKKRIKVCIDFLTQIDESGQILETFQNDDFVDEIKHERNMRIDRLTRRMSESEYLKYHQSRSVSFGGRTKGQKFRSWLLAQLEPVVGPLQIEPFAMEALQFLAHETVAQIVDMAFLVRQGKKKVPFDGVQGTISCKKLSTSPISSASSSSSFSSSSSQFHSCVDGLNSSSSRNNSFSSTRGTKRKVLDEGEGCLMLYDSISPSDIREVTRRFLSRSESVFSLLKKHQKPFLKTF